MVKLPGHEAEWRRKGVDRKGKQRMSTHQGKQSLVAALEGAWLEESKGSKGIEWFKER